MPYFDVYSRMRNMRISPVSVAADGTLALANRNVTVTKIDTGRYGVTLNRSAQQDLFAFPMCIADGVARHIPQVLKSAITAKYCEIRTYSFADALADAPFDLFLVGSDGRGTLFNIQSNLVLTDLARPRMIPFYYDGVNDSVFSKNKWDGTFVKTGTGRYTLTLRRPFQQTPIVVANTTSLARHVEVATKSASVITFETSNSTSAAAADAELFIMIMGSDARQVFGAQQSVLRCPQPYTLLNPYEYDGVADSMLRAGASFSVVRNSAGDYSFTRKKSYPKAGFGLVVADAAANFSCVNNRTNTGFKVQTDADCKVYGLDVGYAKGRDQA